MSSLTLEHQAVDPAGDIDIEIAEQEMFHEDTALLTTMPNVSGLHCLTSRVDHPLLPSL